MYNVSCIRVIYLCILLLFFNLYSSFNFLNHGMLMLYSTHKVLLNLYFHCGLYIIKTESNFLFVSLMLSALISTLYGIINYFTTTPKYAFAFYFLTIFFIWHFVALFSFLSPASVLLTNHSSQWVYSCGLGKIPCVSDTVRCPRKFSLHYVLMRGFSLGRLEQGDIYLRVLPDKFRTELFLSISCKHRKRGPNLLMQELQEEGITDGQTVPKVFGKKLHILSQCNSSSCSTFPVGLLAGKCLGFLTNHHSFTGTGALATWSVRFLKTVVPLKN